MATVEIKEPRIITFEFHQEKGDEDYGTCLWARFNLDLINYSMSIESDCGTFGYSWVPTPQSESFLKLCSRVDERYLLEKISNRNVVDGEAVTEAIKKVMYACSDKTPKPILSGILFESDGEHLNIVACDGYRIAWSKIAYTGNMKVVIPKAAIQKVLSIGLDGGCNLYRFDNKRVVFQTGEYSVYARLLDGVFINYKPMFVDNKPTAKFTVNRIEFYNSVARAIICSSGTTLAKTVLESDVSETNGSLKISLAGSIAEFNEEIELEGEINEKMRIGFNARYLADCLKSSAEKVVTIAYTDEIKPLIITDDSLNQLVLPLRM